MSQTESKPQWLSMTGYAQHEWSCHNRHFKFQIKSVNHRYFEFRLRASKEWQIIESDLKNWSKSQLERGSVDFWIEEISPIQNAKIESENFDKVYQMFHRLNAALSASKASSPWAKGWMPDAVRALILARMPDLWMDVNTLTNTEKASDVSKELIKLNVEIACEKLVETRLTEGIETRLSVGTYSKHLRDLWEQVSKEVPLIRESWKTNLEDRLNKLSSGFLGGTLDPQRIYQEFVLLADKRDVSEELQRIDTHLKALDQHVDSPSENAVGKKLDFFMQELNREWTTLSNKIQNAELNQKVGEAKMTIEKIREQSLNLV